MKYQFVFVLLLVFGISAEAAEDQRIDITTFESVDDSGITMSGGTVPFSIVDDPSIDDVPKHEGDYALYGEYDTSGGAWAQSRINLVNPVDITGMTELHFWIYLLDDSQPHHGGNYTMRVMLPTGHMLGEPQVPATGEWHEIVLPIDRWSSENELSSFDHLRIIWMPGDNSGATGRFYIDEIYAFRPGDTPAYRNVLVYGFNETNDDGITPKGWEAWNGDPPLIGDGLVDPSEGSNYMELILTGAYLNHVRTIDALSDFDDWDKVADVMVDVMMSDDFNTWENFYLHISSPSGGGVRLPIRSTGGYKGEWHTVGWTVDMGPHLPSILSGEGLTIGIITQEGGDGAGSSIFIDNLRVGIPTTFVQATRSFSGSAFLGGETFDVELIVDREGEEEEITVTETVPEGWSVSDISDDGTLSGNTITWTITLGTGSHTLTYSATAPENPTESGEWTGDVEGVETRGEESLFLIHSTMWDLRVEAPFKTNTVTLDGELGADEYQGANTYSFNHDTSEGNTAPGVHLSGNEYPADEENVTFKVFHDSDYIYVGLDVVDPSLEFNANADDAWRNDSIELYLDGNLSRLEVKEQNAQGPQMTVAGDGHLLGGNDQPTPIEADGYWYSEDGAYWDYGARVKDDDSGYVVEYRLNKSVMLVPKDRTIAGFEILMNSSEAGAGDRTGKWGWYSSDEEGVPFEAWDNETGWGIIELLSGDTAVPDWTLY